MDFLWGEDSDPDSRAGAAAAPPPVPSAPPAAGRGGRGRGRGGRGCRGGKGAGDIALRRVRARAASTEKTANALHSLLAPSLQEDVAAQMSFQAKSNSAACMESAALAFDASLKFSWTSAGRTCGCAAGRSSLTSTLPALVYGATFEVRSCCCAPRWSTTQLCGPGCHRPKSSSGRCRSD